MDQFNIAKREFARKGAKTKISNTFTFGILSETVKKSPDLSGREALAF